MVHFENLFDVTRKNWPDAELWTCLVNLDVTSRAELIGLEEGNNARFTNCTQRKHNWGLGKYQTYCNYADFVVLPQT